MLCSRRRAMRDGRSRRPLPTHCRRTSDQKTCGMSPVLWCTGARLCILCQLFQCCTPHHVSCAGTFSPGRRFRRSRACTARCLLGPRDSRLRGLPVLARVQTRSIEHLCNLDSQSWSPLELPTCHTAVTMFRCLLPASLPDHHQMPPLCRQCITVPRMYHSCLHCRACMLSQ